MHFELLFSRLACALFLTACADGSHDLTLTNQAGSGNGTDSEQTDLPNLDEWVSGDWTKGECSEPTQFIYVITTHSELYRFWPPTLTFEKVGFVDCPVMDKGWTPLSMSIDRNARAWILYWDQVVYRLDLHTGQCTTSGYDGNVTAPGPFDYFGMAFAADSAAPEGESLFVREVLFYDGGDPGARRMAHFDTTTQMITSIGEGLGANADLAGTGDGRLFGFEKLPQGSGDIESQLNEYDSKTGERIAATPLDGFTTGDAWAVATWGGDVWLFSSLYGEMTRVARYRAATSAIDIVIPNAGIEVIGAGVSSCAPVAPPE